MTTTDNHVLLFDCTVDGLGSEELRVTEIDGIEELSTPYRYDVGIECHVDGGLSAEDVQSLLYGRCGVAYGPHGINKINGVISEISTSSPNPEGVVGYRFVVRPRLWRLGLTRRSRIFNEMSIPDVLTAVFTTDYGWVDGTDFELKLDGTYDTREYVVQFEETDFEFVSRWMERLGIFYTFEQTDDGDKLVLLDSNAGVLGVPGLAGPLSYSLQTDGAMTPNAVAEIRQTNRAKEGQVHVRDYNWRSSATVTATAPVDPDHGYGVYGEWGLHFGDDGAGATLAQVRAEAILTRAETYVGISAVPDFSVGYHFEVQNCPRGDLDKKYLITRVHHHVTRAGHGAGSSTDYRNEWAAIAFDTPFRPTTWTPWPRVTALVNAIVDGAGGGTAAPIDSLGRYRVQFPWDMHPGATGSATRWIRMAQATTGNDYGMHFPLHLGCEVVIAHVGGDPDRPIIVGSVPNSNNPQHVQSDRATRNVIRTIAGIEIDFENDAP
ncbi:MAG: type VI secretion system tip protein VgrG [Sandaracinaceae bacterium]|nr:type VI secretion system tip protein VgrG [Sandaracinaceae bacterium]